MTKPISYGRQHIAQEDIDAVIEVLRSDYLTQGPKVSEFEKKFANYVDADFAVAVSNGTAALHLSNMALGVKPGCKVITTPITFVSTANSVLYCGGEIDFIDIDCDTFLIDLDKLEEKLTVSPKGTYQGIIPVDFAGYPICMERLRDIVDKYNLWIIEDASHAPGGYFKNTFGDKEYCGNGNYADLHIFSFHPVKHIATGEGGMITTNNKELYKKLLLLRTHGITKESNVFQNSIETAMGNQLKTQNSKLETYPGWYYEMHELGYNYRLSDILAALGISQLDRAEEGVRKRNEIAKKYNKAFEEYDIVTPIVDNRFYHAYHLYIIQVKNRKGLFEFLSYNNIYTQVHYIPVHLQPYYKKLGWKRGDFPIAEDYYEKCLSIPIYPTLSNKEQNNIIDKVINFINTYTKL